MGYRSIDAQLVIQTLETLSLRIEERFPRAGLTKVCAELAMIASDTKTRVAGLAKPILPIRMGVALVLLSGFGFAIYMGRRLSLETNVADLLPVVSGLESIVNLIIIMGSGIYILTNIESRFKRHQAMKSLHELRSIIHVIDMHQLTKDPAMLGGARTSTSPAHDLTAFELVRYLDYCSEMLSLAGKLAALYAQDFNDGDVVEAASDIEQLATNLSQKVWQKITIVQTTKPCELSA
jgi:hypothetical protein